jgi:hypothetical protein
MKRIAIALITIACFAACTKTNQISAVNGSINGVPALTLYGSSGKPTDYILFSTNFAVKLLSYQGQTYSYNNTSTANGIFIVVSSINVLKGTLDTSGPHTVITVDNVAPVTFASSSYSSR